MNDGLRSVIKHELWRRGDLSWLLHPAQLQMYEALNENKSQSYLILCARQLGKTFLGVVYAIEYCLRNPGSLVKIAANTRTQAAEIITDTMSVVTATAPPGLIRPRRSTYSWRVGKSELRLYSMERSVAPRMRGGHTDLFLLEEGGFLNSDDYDWCLKTIIGPQLLRSGGKIVHITTVSEDHSHVIHTEIMPECVATGSFFKYTIYDNPHLTKELLDKAIRLMGGEHTDGFQREYMCRIIRISDILCVPEFSSRNIVDTDVLPHLCNYTIAMDYGGSKDLTSALVLAYDFQNNKTVVVAEKIFGRNTPTKIIIPSIMEWEKEFYISARYADAPAQLRLDIYNDYDYNLMLPYKEDWRASLNQVRTGFSNCDLSVHRRCKHLILTCESGTLNKAKDGFARTKTLGHMDSLAALCYGFRMQDKLHSPIPKQYLNPETHIIRADPVQAGLEAIAAMLPKRRFAR